MNQPVNVVIFEDQRSLRESMKLLISGTPGYQVVATYGSGGGVQDLLELHDTHVVLMDIEMPELDGLSALKKIKSEKPDLKVVMLTVFDDNDRLLEALTNGADGYLLKATPPAQIISAIEEVLDGGAPMSPAIARKVLRFFSNHKPSEPEKINLTERELDVLRALVEGFSYKMIADKLDISIDTVRSHIRHIYRKLQVHSVGEAITKAMRQKLL